MTHTKDEALKLALEALETKSFDLHSEWGGPFNGEDKLRELRNKAITAIKQALAAPVQEPASMDAIYGAWHGAGVDIAGGNWSRFVGMLPPLYTTPPAQPSPVPMTSESAQGVEQDERVFARIAAMNKPAELLVSKLAAVPDAITDNSESVEYKAGWNDCRALMLGGQL